MSIKMVTLLLPAILFIAFRPSNAAESVTLNYTQGDISEFNGASSSYSFTCTVFPTTAYSSYQKYSSDFYYYTNDLDDKVLIQGNIDDNGFSISYNPTDYNSGNYYCEIILRDVSTKSLTTLSHTFRVDSSLSQVELGDSCDANQDCMALNAVCVDGECKCDGAYFVKYNHHGDAPACLLGDLTGKCVIDKQCQVSDTRFTCQGGYCLKTSHARMTPYEIAIVTLGSLAVCMLIVIAGRLATKK